MSPECAQAERVKPRLGDVRGMQSDKPGCVPKVPHPLPSGKASMDHGGNMK